MMERKCPCSLEKAKPCRLFPYNPLARGKGSSKGMALFLVLAFLVLISGLLIAFFSSVSKGLLCAKSYANGVTVKQLADSTVQVAMGVVRQATSSKDSSSSATKLAWASQPGMIRTYDENGSPYAYYKLYSSDNMVVTTFPFDPQADVNSNWKDEPALYTDLNAPVNNNSNPAATTGSNMCYPIVDFAATNTVKGFNIQNPPGYDDSLEPSPVNNPAAMPTKWIYILNDGRLTTPTGVDVTGKIAKWDGSSVVPTATNPIVGRIAFWTDDDTCRVNINTAAGDVWTDTVSSPGAPGNPGAFWDIPRTMSTFEKNFLATNAPANHEFQRYPGHPSTTYLSAVFPNLTDDQIFQIAPRIAPGGSAGGTKIATGPVVLDSDRLYATVDELLFAPPTASANSRNVNPPLSATDVQRAEFFLTANSRAPEVNLFSQPRIVTWPVSSGTTAANRSPYDNILAFCGTLNGSSYYFQRGDPTSQTNDLPPVATSTGVGRNRSLINYLRRLTGRRIPGFGGSTFLSKYSKDRDQILTEIFDYIRALNAQDTSVLGVKPFSITSSQKMGVKGQGQIVPIRDDSHADNNTLKSLRGFGRFPTVREAALVFVGVGQTSGTKKSIPPNASQRPSVPIVDGKTRVQAFFLLSFFDPSQGFAMCVPDFQVRVSRLDNFQWDNIPMGFQSSYTVPINANFNSGSYGGYTGASTFVEAPGYSLISGCIDLPTSSESAPTTFAFTGDSVKVEILDSAGENVLQTLTIDFPSTNFPVPYLAPLLQDSANGFTSLNSDFRDLVNKTYPASSGIFGRFTGGNTAVFSTNSKTWVCGQDVVRSVEANTDYRLIAATQDVASGYFSAPKQYYDTKVRQIHSIAEALNGASLYVPIGGAWGRLVPNANYTYGSLYTTYDYASSGNTTGDQLQPVVVPSSQARPAFGAPIAFGMSNGQCVPVNGVFAGTNATGDVTGYAPGDWDNGFSFVSDGAFINKADEGTLSGLLSGQIPYYANLRLYESAGGTFFSPNRQMPSPVMFGSLPTGVNENRPWQTLLFHPDATGLHRGCQSPPDYLLLDLFTMPVVEPYPISDPFSTAGKINMNYQIIPFTYMVRDTAIRAALKAEQMLALPNSDSATYKDQSATMFANRRTPLDLDQTLIGFQNRFSSQDIFRSASEICGLWLVPQGEKYANMAAYWSSRLLTGDNARERPYGNIYPRLTTKSNTYTVYYRVQKLQKTKMTGDSQWVEGKDTVDGEYRGSTTFERYLDVDDASIPDYAVADVPNPIDSYYKFRVIETKQFAPW